jgi:hypothetical protein
MNRRLGEEIFGLCDNSFDGPSSASFAAYVVSAPLETVWRIPHVWQS